MKRMYAAVKGAAASDPQLQPAVTVLNRAINIEVRVDHKVTMLLAHFTGIAASRIKNEHKLGFHLGIGVTKKRFLAAPLQQIARAFKAGVRIYKREVEGLSTVQDCIGLVKKKIS